MRTQALRRLASVVVLTASAATAGAQRLEDVPLNAHLVVTLRDSSGLRPGNPVVRGQYLGADPDHVRLRVTPAGTTRTVDRRGVVGVAWMQPTGNSGARGALLGLGTGVALTGLASLIVATQVPPCDCHIPPIAITIALGTLLTAGSTIIGGLAGHASREKAVPILVGP